MFEEGTVFNHQNLDVYRTAYGFAKWVMRCNLPMQGDLKAQLTKAAQKVVLNVAEGAQQRTATVARRHYRISLASAAECAAAMDLASLVGTTDGMDEAMALLFQTGQMLQELAS
jgi:four helix bundle protein